ncbi:hypothetical protein EDC04DRAFT_2888408 [Pisolithus marmoratus]|nr:hypothetical protein EDC04DRAFT_2888408 [Pisolithus marmoratus]
MPVIPQPTTALASRSVLFTAPFSQGGFRLDTSAIAGIFGGQTVVSAMATLPVHKGAKWSTFFDGLFPGNHTDPATLFGLDGRAGPKFRAAHSGTVIDDTSHMAALLMKECSALAGIKIEGRRKSGPVGVTIAELHHTPNHEGCPAQFHTLAPVYAIFPILVSLVTCVMCLLVSDWYSFSMILLGIIVSGISCFVIGSGAVLFTHPEPAAGSPRGDGILGSDKEVAILRGEEGAVNSITRGRFYLKFDSEPHYENIGWCSVLLMIQFIAQLLLIPQGTLFGQMMFVTSLAVSWVYNLWLSAFDKEQIQRNTLKNVLQVPRLTKYVLGTRASMVVFVLLILKPEEPDKIMNSLLPNDTKAWRKWKNVIISRIKNAQALNFDQSSWNDGSFIAKDRELLKTLFEDAQDAYQGFIDNGL